jgi:hypothetical protein
MKTSTITNLIFDPDSQTDSRGFWKEDKQKPNSAGGQPIGGGFGNTNCVIMGRANPAGSNKTKATNRQKPRKK